MSHDPNMMDVSRVMIVKLRVNDVLDFFYSQPGFPEFVLRPEAGLPAGYRVLSVNVDWRSRLVEAVVQHPSFDPVPDGEVPPPFGAKDGQPVMWNVHRLVPASEVERLQGIIEGMAARIASQSDQLSRRAMKNTDAEGSD